MSRRRRYNYYEHYAPSRPREAKGGIKAQSKRGSFGESWWAKRWIQVLESFQIGARLARGRSYARSGQVTSIEIEKGLVEAAVQGSRAKPYQVKIKVKTLSSADWKALAGTLGKEALFAAKLLAGEMPEDIEKIFGASGLSLFPGKRDDLETDCSCPDWSNPCKHIAAAYYLLGEEFDRDPFLIFKLRGLSREELVGLLQDEAGERRDGQEIAVAKPESVGLPPEPLPAEPSEFWGKSDAPEDFLGEVKIPPFAAGLPKRLGNFPFWRGEETFLEAIVEIYKTASLLGMQVVLGERNGATEDSTSRPCRACSTP